MQELPRTFKFVIVWLVLGTLVFLLFQHRQARQNETRISLQGDAIDLRRQGDGHFHWPGRINGVDVDFLVDTGATGTAVPSALVSGLPAEGHVMSSTAGGRVRGTVVRVDIALQGGLRAERMWVVALPDLDRPLLGMDVLGRLHFRQQGGVLRIEPAR